MGTRIDGTVCPVPTETVLIDTVDGLLLVGELDVPPSPWGSAVVCHPHPRFGGDMHNAVVETLCRTLAGAGVATLRFDFRGVGRSEGEHDDGVGERLDAAAAVELVAPFAGDGPVVLLGYSFGALVAFDVVHPRLAGWVGVAAPLSTAGSRLAAADHRPKLLLVPEHDQLTPPAVASAAAATGWVSTTIEVVAMADHGLAGRTGVVAERALTFVQGLR